MYHGMIQMSWVSAMMMSMDLLEESLRKISTPLLLLHGTDDALVPLFCSEHLFDAVSSSDKIFEVQCKMLFL